MEEDDKGSGRGGVVICFRDDDGEDRDGISTGDSGRGGYDVVGSVEVGGGDFDEEAFGFLADLSLATPRTKPSATRWSLIYGDGGQATSRCFMGR